MFSFLQPDRFFHIHHQLHLQTMIKSCHIKTLCPGFIIQDLHIDLIFRLTCIDPVNLSASKAYLIALRFKSSLPKLLCHRPDRPVHHTFHTWHDIRVPRTAVDYGIAVIYDTLIHAFRRKLFLLLLCNLSPFQAFPFYPSGIFFQCFMKNISKIKSSKFIDLSLLKAKSIGQKMRTGTGSKFLQS